jgi:hypothetical protein
MKISFLYFLPFFLWASIASPCESGYGQNNAMWIQSLFLRGYSPSTKKKLTEEDIQILAAHLRTTKIKYAYLFAGPFDRSGNLPDYAASPLAKKTLSQLRELAPDTIFLAWVGGIQFKEVFISDPLWIGGALKSSARILKETGFDGLHVDFEYLLFGAPPASGLHYGERFNAFFRTLRARFPRTFISTVVTSTAPDVRPWKYKSRWFEISELSHYVDQIALLFFDTHIRDRETYEANLSAQIKDVAAWKMLNPTSNCEYLVGAGTFVNKDPSVRAYRDMRIENLPNHLSVLKRIVDEQCGTRRLVDGLAIFCDWETTNKEWEQLRQYWSSLKG